MKIEITTLLLTSTLLMSNAIQASQEKLYTAKKYPYNLLISRTQSVKIIYTDEQENINCKVAVNWQNKTLTSVNKRVKKQDFIKEPLASCLARNNAKDILSKTFE
ncbi:hypothetical protein AADZ91_11175 [Colwelliaceae bacterium 6441]